MTTKIQGNQLGTSNDEISLKDLILKIRMWWRYLLSKWLIILVLGLVGGALGYLYAWLKKPVYIAVTTFVLEEPDGGGASLSGLGGLASMAGINLTTGGGIFQGDNIFELYKSRTMIEKTLFTEIAYDGKKQLLLDRYIEFNELRKKWAKKPELAKLHFTANDLSSNTTENRLRDSVLSTIIDDININSLNVFRPDKKLSIIRAEVKSIDEVFAKTFNEQIVKNVNDFYVQTKTKKSIDNVTILQQKTDSVRAVMNGAIYNAAAVADATPNMNPTRQLQRTAPIQRSQFSGEINKTILGTLIQNLEMAKIALRKETPLIYVVDKPIYPLVKNRLGGLKGVIIGGILAGLLTLIALIVIKIFRGIMA